MMLRRATLQLCCFALCLSVLPGREGPTDNGQARDQSALLFLTAGEARAVKSAFAANASHPEEPVRRLRRMADERMTRGPWSVTFLPSEAASGDPHDYYSEGPYWWPDPENPDGPYIRRDGEVNPKHFTAHRHALGEMSEAVLALGMAAYFFDERRYADRAAHVLRVWFIDPKTRMNPHLEYGQAIHGRTTGRGIGIIDTRPLIHVVQGLAFLEQSGMWNQADRDAVRMWFAGFLQWLTHSAKGLDEKKHGNNHSTWWAVQAASFAIYLGDTPTQKMVWNLYRDFLVPHQMRPDGSCPLEEARTKSLSYSAMNLDGFAQLCHLARNQGVDLWHYRSANGVGIQKCLAYLTPFIERPQVWAKRQIHPFETRRRSFLALAGIGLEQPESLKLYTRLPPAEGAFSLLVDLLAGLSGSTPE